MAIKLLSFENFKGQSKTIEFFESNLTISGTNGVGKSTIRDAIAFVLTGRDSSGLQNPIHLISWPVEGRPEASSLKVELQTSKFSITRSLTRKGSTTIKVTTENGLAGVYTQSQLNDYLGHPDVILSSIIPGYYASLDATGQRDVISKIMPPLSRVDLLKEILGESFVINEIDHAVINNNTRRPDLLASDFSARRRAVQTEIDQLNGRIQQIDTLEVPSQPVLPTGVDERITQLNDIKLANEKYAKAVKDFNYHQNSVTSIKNDIILVKTSIEQVKQQANEEKAKIKVLNKPKLEDISVYHTQMKSYPSRPAMANVVNTDYCTTCGQAVSSKQREAVVEKNLAALAAFEAEHKAVDAHNLDLKSKIGTIMAINDRAEKAYRDDVEHNRAIEHKVQRLRVDWDTYSRRLTELEKSLASLTEFGMEEPKDPMLTYSADEHTDLSTRKHEFEVATRSWQQLTKLFESAKTQREQLVAQIEPKQAQVDYLKSIETALKSVPELETKKRAGLMTMGDTMLREDGAILWHGLLRSTLSTGQQMIADTELCIKISSLMKNSVKTVFIDSANLISRENLDHMLSVYNKDYKFVVLNTNGSLELEIFVLDVGIEVDVKFTEKVINAEQQENTDASKNVTDGVEATERIII